MINRYLSLPLGILVSIAFFCQELSAQRATYVNRYRRIPPPKAKIEYPDEAFSHYTIAVHPFYLFNGGMRIDFETRLHDKNRLLQFSLMGNYYDNSHYSPFVEDAEFLDFHFNTKLDSLSRLRGIGFGIGYKQFISGNSLYILATSTYNLYSVYYAKDKLEPFTENGLTYYQSKYVAENQKFHKINAAINFGIQTPLRDTFLLDFYLGLGYVHSFYDKNKKPFNDSMTNYGYRGVALTGGLRIGFSFGKDKGDKK